MREVKVMKYLPWLVLFLLWGAGTTLWLLFVSEQQLHLSVSFQNQLERTSEELLRGRLEGRLGPDSLPEDIRAFAVYGPSGELVASWGVDVPVRIAGNDDEPKPTSALSKSHEGWVDFIKVLTPLRPRLNLWGDADDQAPARPQRGARLGMGPMPMSQGYLFLRVSSAPLEGRLWAWTIGGGLGSAAWAGFLAFVGVLWFRARRYQSALVQHRELLQFAEASRTLSHELQNPLAAILLQTALLKRGSDGDAGPEVAIIEEEARRMSSLVARVRDFLKDPQGQPEPVDLAELAAALAGRFAVDLALSLDGPSPFLVRFDPHRLRSVVENLFKNAVESGPDPQPEVRVSRPKSGWVRLEVLDSGTGFTAESLRQARQPFYTTKTTGTGIGLSITDSFVGAAGGKLKFENRSEGGARVTLDLPEAPQEAKP
jgi:signal transduction histidine kinase